MPKDYSGREEWENLQEALKRLRERQNEWFRNGETRVPAPGQEEKIARHFATWEEEVKGYKDWLSLA